MIVPAGPTTRAKGSLFTASGNAWHQSWIALVSRPLRRPCACIRIMSPRRESMRWTSGQGSLGHHHFDKLFIVDLAIAIDIGLADHLIDLFIRELLTKVRHHMTKLGGRDESVAITVEDLEGLDQLLLGVGVLHLARHEAQELGEIDSTVAIRIYLIDHVLQLSFSWVLAQRAHHRAKLFGRDSAISVL